MQNAVAVMLMLAALGSSRLAIAAEREADTALLARGRAVYQAACAVCHGEGGDGRGHAAHMLRIQPRDFTRGLFKFRSTPSGSLPTDADLLGTIARGLRWTGMIGRPDLPERDRRAVVRYVKTFAPRFAAESTAPPVVVPPAPPAGPADVDEGRRLWTDAECAKCHGAEGRGDGPSATGMKDDWGRLTRPTDLTWRPLKRGAAPEETYLSIATGLAGTPMPAYGDALEPREIWALVRFLESLVPPERRLAPTQVLGEERAGWMAVRMGGMMGPGMMGPGMMMPRGRGR